MGRINLDVLKQTQSERKDVSVFKDLKLDILLNSTQKNELSKDLQVTDIQVDNNEGAIKNSIRNILSTSPGEKLLNPLFGCSFGDLLFLPVTESRARLVGQTILTSITKFEPRVKVVNIDVLPQPEDNQYTVTFTIQIPRFSTKQIKLRGTINRSQFSYI